MAGAIFYLLATGGVNIDEILSGEGILDTIVRKYNGGIEFMYGEVGCIPTALKTPGAHHLTSVIGYAILSWYAAITRRVKHKLQVMQNKIIRFILDLQPRIHWTFVHITKFNKLREYSLIFDLQPPIFFKTYTNVLYSVKNEVRLINITGKGCTTAPPLTVCL